MPFTPLLGTTSTQKKILNTNIKIPHPEPSNPQTLQPRTCHEIAGAWAQIAMSCSTHRLNLQKLRHFQPGRNGF